MHILRTIKPEIRILAFDDGPFEFGTRGKDVLIGTIFRGGLFLDGVLKTDIEIDGDDAEKKIIDLVNRTKHKDQLRVIMLDGITFAGLNIVNIKKIFESTHLPVIVINRKMPDFEKFLGALRRSGNKRGLECVEAAGPVYKFEIDKKCIYFQFAGCDKDVAERVIKISTTHAAIPEPLRIAHLIATAIVRGESIGRA